MVNCRLTEHYLLCRFVFFIGWHYHGVAVVLKWHLTYIPTPQALLFPVAAAHLFLLHPPSATNVTIIQNDGLGSNLEKVLKRSGVLGARTSR
jgi:hypothetical protein